MEIQKIRYFRTFVNTLFRKMANSKTMLLLLVLGWALNGPKIVTAQGDMYITVESPTRGHN